MLDFGANLELVSCLKHSPCDFSLWFELCINIEAGSKGKVEERERGGETEGGVERTVSDDDLAGMQHYLPWLLSIEAVTKSLPSSKSIGFPTWQGVAMLWRSRWDWKDCCGCFGGCILPHSCLRFPSLPKPAPSPSSHLSWHLLVSFLHILLTMAQTHRKEGDVCCPFLDSHVQTNKVIKVTASTWQPPVGNAKAKKNVCKVWAFQIFFSCQQKQLDLGTCS